MNANLTQFYRYSVVTNEFVPGPPPDVLTHDEHMECLAHAIEQGFTTSLSSVPSDRENSMELFLSGFGVTLDDAIVDICRVLEIGRDRLFSGKRSQMAWIEKPVVIKCMLYDGLPGFRIKAKIFAKAA